MISSLLMNQTEFRLLHQTENYLHNHFLCAYPEALCTHINQLAMCHVQAPRSKNNLHIFLKLKRSDNAKIRVILVCQQFSISSIGNYGIMKENAT